MGAAVRFKQLSVPRQAGEQARLKVLQGPDYGAVYVITGARTTLGRGEENDMMVSDLKASRKHAEFVLTPMGWQVRDLGSANGLLHNGRATRDARINTGDTLTFGETTLEFMASEAGTRMLVAPPRSGTELAAERSAFEEQRKKVRAVGAAASLPGGAQPQAAGNPRTLLYLAVAGGVAFMLFSGDPEPAPKPSLNKKKQGASATEDLSKYLPGAVPLDPTTERTAEQFFKAGFREYISGNYLRAKTQFETVLQMAPGHALATLYLQNCETSIQDEIKFHLEQGKVGAEAGKLKEARAHFEAVLRILYRDQSNASVAEARDQLEKVNRKLAGKPETGLEGEGGGKQSP
jgi:pSer/pThr/pTyr-binding forkhead associated (FHA) protein